MENPITTCILVRHGHVEGIDPPRFRGRINLPLTDLGERQAAALAARIAREWKPDAIFTSSLQRCVATASTIAHPTGLTPRRINGFVDRDYGAWQGLDHTAVAARWPQLWANWNSDPDTTAIPDGETLPDVSTRAVAALERITASERGRTVVVVTHDCINRLLLLNALGMPLSMYHHIAQSPCALNVLTLTDHAFDLVTLNEHGHLIGL